jgi:hypothetical protein
LLRGVLMTTKGYDYCHFVWCAIAVGSSWFCLSVVIFVLHLVGSVFEYFTNGAALFLLDVPSLLNYSLGEF